MINKNKIVSAILAFVILGIIIALIIIPMVRKDTKYQVGNLNNLGFSVADYENVYCVGYKEGMSNGIFRISGSNEKKISDDNAYYLNKDGSYVYYLDINNNNIIKMKTNGKDKQIIIEDVEKKVVTVQRGYIYYFSNSYFYRAKVTGENKKRISNKEIESYQIIGDTVYYSYKENGKYTIAKMKTNGENVKIINSNSGRAFIVKGNNIYYIYESNDIANFKINYILCKMSINGKNNKKIKLIDGGIDISTINFVGEAVYYIKEDDESKYKICKMDLDGKNEIQITEVKGYTTKININKNLVYFPDEDDNGNVQMYRIKINGKGQREEICK